VSRAPRASHIPGRPARTVPCSRQWRPSSLVAYAVLMRSSAPGTSRGWQQIHASQRLPTRRTMGSFTPLRASLGKAGRGSAEASPARSSASSRSICQALVCGFPVQMNIRHPPCSVRTRAGRSIHGIPNCDASSVNTVESVSPSTERATTFWSTPSLPCRTR
jgi:hypothetical protein